MNIQNRAELVRRLVQNGMRMVELHATWGEPRFNDAGVSPQIARQKLRDWRIKAQADYYRKIKKEFGHTTCRRSCLAPDRCCRRRHLYDRGGMRRLHLRGRKNILKRLLAHSGAANLGLLMRKLFGKGTPRGLREARQVMTSLGNTTTDLLLAAVAMGRTFGAVTAPPKTTQIICVAA
jgi:hypothetical protein